VTPHRQCVFTRIHSPYRMLLSLLIKNRPRMLTANTRKPDSLSTFMIVCTVSYRIALPAFLLASVLVATCASSVFMASLAVGSPLPSTRSICRILAWRKGSTTPPMSYSGTAGDMTSFRSSFTSPGTILLKRGTRAGMILHTSTISVRPVSSTLWDLSLSKPAMRGRKSGIMSGTLLNTRMAHNAAWIPDWGSITFTE
jgi:hypothetical protein